GQGGQAHAGAPREGAGIACLLDGARPRANREDCMHSGYMNNPLLARPKRPLPARVGVVGAGTIGPDIGYYLKSELPDLHLVLIDVRQEALDAAVKRIHGYVEKGIQRGKLDPAKADRIRANIVATRDYG